MIKKYIKYKMFSGALQFTIFISLVIALILAAFLLLNHTHRFFLQQSKSGIENLQLCNSGFNFILSQNDIMSDTLTINALSNNNQKVEASLSYWGIFQKGTIKATHRKKTSYKVALIGDQIPSKNRPNLYLKDNFKPLKIVGKTFLKGNIYLPDQGIGSGYIAGQSFNGQNLVEGKSFNSSPSLPKLIEHYAERIENSVSVNKEISLNTITKKLTNSFLKPTIKIHSSNEILLENLVLIGNICIQSDERIKLSSSSIIKDIILIAPIIEIEDNVTGNFQAISEKEILIGKNCKLNYPSSLVLLPPKSTTTNNIVENQSIFIDTNTEIRGSILCFKPNLESYENNNFKTDVFLNNSTKIIGEIYCEGNLELKGKVIGSVYTNQFITNAFGTIYINHIFGGEITNENFPESFCGIIFERKTKNIAKWLY